MSRRRVLRVAAREQPAFEVVRHGGELATRRGALGLNRNGTTLADPLQELLRVGGQPAQLPVACLTPAAATSAGHSRRCTSVSFPSTSFAQATVSSIRVSVSKISFPFGWPHHDPRIGLARDARRRRRKLRVVEQQQPVRCEQPLDPAPCALDLCVGGRRRRDSNPRRFRATVFKTVAFDHSATPPD